ncbi:MAG: DNA mismatch repair endonuclease MutL [Colwellia sp.]|nr:DNA mismatch repair endonuclease MutL [Colwellia sp.]
MTIEILPARLANQIAAGEVVERPASVVKELVENSLDANATTIKIDIEKGGAKRIRISDNGSGIAKEELTLALSRHATSKIKNLNDLEAISSLGFRGEALASISSVSRLTLTSKPKNQDSAWQACAEGRDMQVEILPAAHPDGTTIDVKDLFFNTPARRKFMRTEKTEFSHIDEVVKRIALARLDVTFILTHNEKVIRQYRGAKNKSQYAKRVAQICGHRFIENALEVDCQHDDLHFSGWLGKPSFARNQNDLCYSYVNGRMMRDKLINHAIRQAYADLLPPDTYPAFVLFLECDYREVDVNVHPAKHEVRFHQGRYIHDFIVSVCQQTLAEQRELAQDNVVENNEFKSTSESQHSYQPIHSGLVNQEYSQQQHSQQEQVNQSYIKPLTPVSSNDSKYYSSGSVQYQSPQVSERAAQSYQRLMTPLVQETEQTEIVSNNDISVVQSSEQQCLVKLINIVESKYATILIKNKLRLLSLSALEQYLHLQNLRDKWQNGLISQPLLLPIKLSLDSLQMVFIKEYQTPLEKCGVVIKVLNNTSLQIRAFPSLLRDKDVSYSFTALIEPLMGIIDRELTDEDWLSTFSFLMTTERYDDQQALSLLNRVQNKLTTHFEQQLLLNSITIDLTSAISQFK